MKKTTEKDHNLLQYLSHIIGNQEVKEKASDREAWKLLQTNP